MIVSYDESFDNYDSLLNITYKDSNVKRKKPLYSQTIRQLERLTTLIDGIIIPADLKSADYNPIKMIEHIRLSTSCNINKAKVIINDKDNIINDDRLEDHIGYGIDIINDNSVDFDSIDELKEKDLNKIISIIGVEVDSMTKHDQANIWGPYRLVNQLNKLNMNDNCQLVKQYEANLSESLFFKKLLIKESHTESFKIRDNDKTTFNLRLKEFRESVSKVAIIDDEINHWGDAYKALLKCNTDLFDQQNSIFEPKQTSNYDLIILDLRLEERSTNDGSDQLNIENISGMILLDKIKKTDPTVPVIMCTASNKSWSHDVAVSKGADGFWTKESPTVSIGLDYSFHNTFDLINVCFSALQWSIQVKPIFTKMNLIHDRIETIHQGIASSFRLKYDLIASNLLRPPNQFINKTFKNTLDFPFLIIWSIVNDIKRIVIKKRTKGKIEYVDCHFNKQKETIFTKNRGEKYKIYKELDKIAKWYEPRFYVDEKVIMEYLLFKTFDQKLYKKNSRKWNSFRKIRNQIDVIHGDDGKDKKDIKLNHIESLLNIYHEIIIKLK